jgi:hypothetical protein
MNRIIIHEPFIRQIGDKTRLAAVIERPGEDPFELFYEVDNAYGQYLYAERSDPFLLGVLDYAMNLKLDIECSKPVTERLYYQLTSYAIPILSQNLSFFNPINITAALTNEAIDTERGVGTGFSGGVDSYYTVLKHIHPQENSQKLTHLLFANVGALTHAGGDVSKDIFERKMELFGPVAVELGLPLIGVHTNYMEFSARVEEITVHAPHAYKTGSCVYALAKLFSIFYWSSSLQLTYFKFYEKSMAWYDFFNVYAISSNNIQFHLPGFEVNRLQKVAYIADNPLVQKSLSVCAGLNCNHCNKCIRTMMELYALGKLDAFSAVFDIQDFKNHLARRFAVNFANKVEEADGFNAETIEAAGKNKVKIPLSAYVLSGVVYKPFLAIFTFIKDKLRKVGFVRKLYYQFNIDIKLHGEESARLSRQRYREIYCESNGNPKKRISL